VEHPLLKPGSISHRQFQVDIAAGCMKRNTLVVIPTGLGKTVIAALVIAEKISRTPLDPHGISHTFQV
jgi:Fanconi anemia group M protein